MRTANIFTQITQINTTNDVVSFRNTTGKRVIISFTLKTQYRQFSNVTNNIRPQVLNLKEKGIENRKKLVNSQSLSFFKTTAQAIESQLNSGNLLASSQSIEEIKNISLPVDLNKNVIRFKKRKLLTAYLKQLQIKKLNAVKFTFKLKNRLLNRKTVVVSYTPKVNNTNKVNFLQQLLTFKQKVAKHYAITKISNKNQTMFLNTHGIFRNQKVFKRSKLKMLHQQKVSIKLLQKVLRFQKQRYSILKPHNKFDSILTALMADCNPKKRMKKNSLPIDINHRTEISQQQKDSDLEGLLTKYKVKTQELITKITKKQRRLKYYLILTQLRVQKDLSKGNEVEKKQEIQKKNEQKQQKSIQTQFIKKVLTGVLQKNEQQQETQKALIIKILLNILRRKGEVTGEGNMDITYPYLKEVKKKQRQLQMAYVAANIKMKLVNDFIDYKGDSRLWGIHVNLIKSRNQYLNIIETQFENEENVYQNPIYKTKLVPLRSEVEYLKKTRYMKYGVNSRNKITILNNVMESDKKLYNLRLPKQRVQVPTLLTIYKNVRECLSGTRAQGKKEEDRAIYQFVMKLEKLKRNRNRKQSKLRISKQQEIQPQKEESVKKEKVEQIPLRQGVLRITLKRRNMFLVCQNKSTKHVDTSLTARQEYYRIYNTKDFDAITQKGKKDLKATTVKPKGPIGRFISTEVFRRRVITQALLNLRAQIKYNVLDIEIRNPTSNPLIKTILYKNWYVYKNQGLLRMYKFTKNKAHGSMRQKKARRL
uniref:Uncharacterized mitochondrial protein Mp36 n=1 Tax=Dictyostelium citrinum TaxID=361072 RepID=MP036_DICCI|nr:Mp36-like protein [Dictyostelium citrinum]Q2LCP4.1 RecName: Full=Uncharacterized mitochondrial protein Mp36; AltName: Full=ORF760 [Dictyostelium citrinum]ABC60399.1 Mp36-like protein [Dictyostelium citrinum]